MSDESPGRLKYEYAEGGRHSHWLALLLALNQIALVLPGGRLEPRNLSRYANNSDIEIDYPTQAGQVLDFVSARDPRQAEVLVWDVWPANTTIAPPSVVELVSSRIADLAAAEPNLRVDLGWNIAPATWYFPENPVGWGGYWLSVFSADAWEGHAPPDTQVFAATPGIVFYQQLDDPNPGPFRIDNPMPGPIQVPAPGVYPPAPS